MTKQGNDKGSHEEAAERRAHAFDMRKRGASYRAIGRELGVSEKTAHQDVQRVLAGLAELEKTSAEEYRQVELERLDLALLALAPKFRMGDVGAVNTWIKVSESRRKLLGLDAPAQVQIGGSLQSPLYLELRTMVLQLLPAEQRLLLADALDQVIDASTVDRPEDGT